MLKEKFRIFQSRIRHALLPASILLVYAFLLSWIDSDAVSYLLNLVLAFVAVSAISIVCAQRKRELQISNACAKQLLVEAAIAVKRAEDVNLAKAKFLAAASHDLRQPVHAQNLFLGMLARTELTQTQQEIVANLNAAAIDSGNMLNALLEFSRIEAGLIKPHNQAVRIQPLLQKLKEEFAPLASAKGVIYRTHASDLFVKTDPILIEIILRKLIANAILYTDSGWVLVAARKRGNQVLFEVRDTGVGIDTTKQQEVFQVFKRLEPPQRDGCKGLGLGLVIADGLALVLGAALTFTAAHRRGSIFRISLPITDGIMTNAEPHMEHMTDESCNGRALLIEDNVNMRGYMHDLLLHWGCKCDAATSVDDALALARANKPNFLISDYRLNESRNGIEAIAEIRALLGAALPAMLITGDTTPERVAEARANNIHLLHKPLSASELRQEIMQLLRPVK